MQSLQIWNHLKGQKGQRHEMVDEEVALLAGLRHTLPEDALEAGGEGVGVVFKGRHCRQALPRIDSRATYSSISSDNDANKLSATATVASSPS